ncbi:hypothetical protein MBLNU230_g8314t1 [Neophaeotheca triangularis]
MPSARFNLPPFTRGLLFALLFLSAVNAVLRYRVWAATNTPSSSYLSHPNLAVPWLVLVPARSWVFPWTVGTAALIEQNIVSLGISAVVVWFGGKYLERAWGSREFGVFVLFVTMIPNLLTFSLYALWHNLLASKPAYPTPINGLLPLHAAFLVALKQLVPEHTVSLFSNSVRIRLKHFPAIFLLANVLSGPILGTDTAVWLSLFGFFTGWLYLRFYRVTELSSTAATGGEGDSVKMRGDASDTFAFVAFWPEVVQPFMRPVCDAVYEIMVQVRVCTPFSSEAVEAGNENAATRSQGGLPTLGGGGGGGGGGAKRAEAERRRALALKALEQRLNAGAGAGAGGQKAPQAATADTSSNGDAQETQAGAAESAEGEAKGNQD